MINTKKCLICNEGKKNDVLYWHRNPEKGDIWCWCNKCDRAYSLHSYCYHAGIELREFLKGDFNFQEAKTNEVNKAEFPNWYVTMSDPRAKDGVEYIKSRGLELEGDMYYDMDRHGIVFPYYYENTFVGAQTRFIEPRVWKDGTVQKMDTMPGTRTGLLFYGWNQAPFMTHVKGVIVTEGAFNAIAIQQALNKIYGSISSCPWRVIACSGSGVTGHQKETLKDLKERGYKIVVAPDSDEAGLKMLKKFHKGEACTHYMFTGDSEKDWNDMLKELGHEEFGKFILKSMKNA